MTLNELISKYKNEDYKFWKYFDKDGSEILTYFHFESHSDYLDKYLGFYKELPNLTEVIVYASDGIFKISNQGVEYFIRHNHQEVFKDKEGHLRGISYDISKQVRNNLIMRINDIIETSTFDQLYEIVNECKVKGFGELSIYDTAMRIASHMKIEPDKVYLHAGARKGIEILEEKGYVRRGSSKLKYIELKNMPKTMQELKAAENEHLLCSMKENMLDLDEVNIYKPFTI